MFHSLQKASHRERRHVLVNRNLATANQRRNLGLMINTNLSLLLVVSDKTTALISAFRLRLLGYHVEMVGRGEDVAALFPQFSPGLAIVELALPGLSGFETISQLGRELPTQIPVIALSPDSSQESVKQAFLAGASEYLLMPFDPAMLEQKIETLISDSESMQLVSSRGA